MNLPTIVLRSLLYDKARTVLTIVGGAIGLVAFVLVQTLISAWNVSIEFGADDRLGTAHKVSLSFALPRTYVEPVRSVDGVRVATFSNWFGGKNPRDPDDFFATFAVDTDSFLQVYPEMLVSKEDDERWRQQKNGAIVGDVLARKLGVKIGDPFTLTGTIYGGDWPFVISGIYRATDKSVDRSQFLFHWSYFNERLPVWRRERVGWIVSRTTRPELGPAVSASIDKLFDGRDVRTRTMSEKALALSYTAGVSAALAAADIVSVIILVVMMLVLGNTIAMGVRERTPQFGVLRALGFEPSHLHRLVLGEGFLFGLLSALLGLALAYPIVERGIGAWIEENMGGYFPYFEIAPRTAVLALVATLLVATVSALVPAERAARMPVSDALRARG
jgi:putative ABC transport system permease protein